MEIGIGLVYIAWYSFVFAMCYFFSPWFVLLLFMTPKYTNDNKSEVDDKKSIKPMDTSSKEN
ncbi:MAG: hypothetical protein HDT42_04820 [Ruminococcaceae bacterium]|nr:hypothetical protein [Oscillospiraceae bacterium]